MCICVYCRDSHLMPCASWLSSSIFPCNWPRWSWAVLLTGAHGPTSPFLSRYTVQTHGSLNGDHPSLNCKSHTGLCTLSYSCRPIRDPNLERRLGLLWVYSDSRYLYCLSKLISLWICLFHHEYKALFLIHAVDECVFFIMNIKLFL